MSAVLAVALGGVVGAPLRYHLDRLIQSRCSGVFPWGTLTVNVVGCCVLGLLVAGASSDAVGGTAFALLGTGFCGALTTYSTFGYETLRLFEEGVRLPAVANVCVSVFAGLGAAFAGAAAGTLLWAA